MILCPACGGRSSVIDSRPHESSIRRRRECKKCGQRWSTTEVPYFDMEDMVHREHLSLAEIALRVGKTERAVAIDLSRRGIRAGYSVPNRRRPFVVPPSRMAEYKQLAKKGIRVAEIGRLLGLV